MSLSPDEVVEAALRILDEYGFADLSMRRVAEVLGVKAGAIYWHFANKQTMLAAVSDKILTEPVELGPAEGEQFLHWAVALRAALLAHRDAGELVASTLAFGLGRVDPASRGSELLVLRGWPADQAARVAQAVVHFVLGHVVEEQSRRQLIDLKVVGAPAEALDEAGFEAGLQVLLAGIEALTPAHPGTLPG